jgi:serine/threonine protein kinase
MIPQVQWEQHQPVKSSPYDIGSADGIDFIAMEFVAGKTLDRLIPRHGLRLSEALKYSVQVADALGAAHKAGIVHRDLKPGNVMVTEQGLVKVLDFGLAKLTESTAPGEDEATRPLKPTTGGHHRRDRLLHVARAGRGQEGRCTVRHLQLWRTAL